MRVADRPRGGVVGRPEHRGHATPAAAARCIAPESFVTQAARASDNTGQRWQIGQADQIDHHVAPGEGIKNRFPGRRVGRTADHHAHDAVSRQRVRELGKVRRRPALGAAIRRPRGQRDQRRLPVPPTARQQPHRGGARVDRHGEARLGGTVRKSKRVDQLLVVLDLVDSPRSPDRPRQQAASPAGAVAPALGDAGAQSDQRRMDRVRKQERGVEPIARELGAGFANWPRHRSARRGQAR